MLAIPCPNCGQENINNGKLQYCSYCFARFPLDLVGEQIPAETAEQPTDSEQHPAPAAESQSSVSASQNTAASPPSHATSAPPAPAAANPVGATEATAPASAQEETETLPPAVDTSNYTSMYCPHCMAELPYGTAICSECHKDTRAWL